MAPQKKSKSSKASKVTKAVVFSAPDGAVRTAIPPSRIHHSTYHYPLLLRDREACEKLLCWFEGVEETRNMPWRKKWVDPKNYEENEEELGRMLTKRAYEVWVSEVMLQQTRVSTVIPYFNNWIGKWPTVEDLAEADHDDVLAAWKGLGYYSRATRLHEGAKVAMSKKTASYCRIPSKAIELQNLPGIGRYTAGAISSIAFGEAEPVLDGNVARVLSRQLGLHVDAKDKNVSDLLWDEADRLIKYVSDLGEDETSDLPGKWNQALMELGSTICTPRPQCDACPIQSTCRVYGEGQVLSEKRQSSMSVPDIEDACKLCEVLDTEDLATAPENVEEDNDEEVTPPAKRRKGAVTQTNTLSTYFAIRPAASPDSSVKRADDLKAKNRALQDAKEKAQLKSITTYCALFPKKVAKKKAAEEECVVCMIELRLPDKTSKWLIEQRPAKGLLASLWQFPQSTLTASATTATQRKATAQDYVKGLKVGDIDMASANYVATFQPLVHVFTHLRLTMHAYQFLIDVNKHGDLDGACKGLPARKWVETGSMDQETLSTGMRKCWDLLES